MNADMISEVVRELIGKIEPCGDSAIDKERRTNLHTLIHVMDVLLDDVCEITTQRYRKEGSICQMVDMAEDAITDWHDLIEDYMGVNSAYTQPTVEPERKRGKWIWSPVADDGTVSGCCNKCSFSHVFIGGHTAQYNYCPNCGADMRRMGDEDE